MFYYINKNIVNLVTFTLENTIKYSYYVLTKNKNLLQWIDYYRLDSHLFVLKKKIN